MTSFSGGGDSPARAACPAFELSGSHCGESPCWDYIAAIVEIATSFTVRAMSSEKSKREVPGGLKAVLEKDVKLSKEFVELVNRKYPIAAYRSHLKSLEISCHGIPWLFISVAGLYSFGSQFFFNLLLALLLDIVVVAVIKAFTRRRRPSYNVDDQYATVKLVDKFSFPSGHSTRAVMLATLFTLVAPINIILWLPLVGWAGAVCVSRVLLGRHHLLDVLAGVPIGLIQAVVMGWMWRSEDQTKYIMSLFGDEDPWSSA